MKKNSLEINPQMWEYGGLRMNEVNFLKFCLYIKLIMERGKLENQCEYWFDSLADIFIEGRSVVSFNQLWYYIERKWNFLVEWGTSIRSGWINYGCFNMIPYNNTYKKVYDEIKKIVDEHPNLTIDMVMKYYNPKESTDILSFYTEVHPDLIISISRIGILYRYTYMLYREIKDNTLGMPNGRVEYKIYPYEFYVSNELALNDKPKTQLPAIYATERYPFKEYEPVTEKIVIKSKFNFEDDASFSSQQRTCPNCYTNRERDYGKFDMGILYNHLNPKYPILDQMIMHHQINCGNPESKEVTIKQIKKDLKEK